MLCESVAVNGRIPAGLFNEEIGSFSCSRNPIIGKPEATDLGTLFLSLIFVFLCT